MERNTTNLTKRMTWGLDLSQSLQGAGGVGGLVMVEDPTSGTPVQHFPTYDGNGNITAWVNASGSVVARQRYDAYGNIIAQTGTAPSNYGFSTKPMDQVTGLYYYGYRYYDPITGRWPSRDPIEERGGVNLYGFVGNDGLGGIDLLGRKDIQPPLPPGVFPPPDMPDPNPNPDIPEGQQIGYYIIDVFVLGLVRRTKEGDEKGVECPDSFSAISSALWNFPNDETLQRRPFWTLAEAKQNPHGREAAMSAAMDAKARLDKQLPECCEFWSINSRIQLRILLYGLGVVPAGGIVLEREPFNIFL